MRRAADDRAGTRSGAETHRHLCRRPRLSRHGRPRPRPSASSPARRCPWRRQRPAAGRCATIDGGIRTKLSGRRASISVRAGRISLEGEVVLDRPAAHGFRAADGCRRHEPSDARGLSQAAGRNPCDRRRTAAAGQRTGPDQIIASNTFGIAALAAGPAPTCSISASCRTTKRSDHRGGETRTNGAAPMSS